MLARNGFEKINANDWYYRGQYVATGEELPLDHPAVAPHIIDMAVRESLDADPTLTSMTKYDHQVYPRGNIVALSFRGNGQTVGVVIFVLEDNIVVVPTVVRVRPVVDWRK